MKVASFVVGVVNGLTEAMERLDAHVTELGEVTILSVTDTVVDRAEVLQYPQIVRVVTYEPRT